MNNDNSQPDTTNYKYYENKTSKVKVSARENIQTIAILIRENKRKTIIYTILAAILLLACLISYNAYVHTIPDNLPRFKISDIVEYNEEYGIFYTPPSKEEYLKQDIVLTGYTHIDKESDSIYLTNMPYIDNYLDVAKYGVVTLPVTNKIDCTDSEFIICVANIVETDEGLKLRIDKYNDGEDYKSTKQTEFEDFMSESYTSILDNIREIPDVALLTEDERRLKIHKMFIIKQELQDNFYDNTEDIMNIVDYLCYVNANPQLSPTINTQALEEKYTKSIIEWGKI